MPVDWSNLNSIKLAINWWSPDADWGEPPEAMRFLPLVPFVDGDHSSDDRPVAFPMPPPGERASLNCAPNHN